MFLKATFETLDFAEYFCSKAKNKDLLWDFAGYKEMERALTFQTFNEKYANRLADLYGFDHVNINVDKKDLKNLIEYAKTHLSKRSKEYLTQRSFPLELCSEFDIGSFNQELFKDFDFGTLNSYWLFNQDRIEYLNYLLEVAKFSSRIEDWEFILIPSFDFEGNVNNIALRVLNHDVEEKIFKWLFTHGRCATFGLEKCELNSTLLVVEGFFDYVACIKSGMKNVVGLGSAYFSEDHIEEILKVSNKIDISFDNDETGIKNRIEPKGLILNSVKSFSDKYKDPYEMWSSEKKVEFF